ncbi:hypothetical protein EII29_07080 [Leptotrichia sp. OH3620_COT-345]|uniref:hypothetical protein n=1 Tax=Leptotrichia sp. OH3620_COT-345 TaxID=2491048 RepID=UPI000F652912|nr:hypothetical protein [Leptotrichia sp. OH3620_COT-345]RRD39349.1 hypothetical protein EII29_07080 [Leptotrichia sp. OH3620_COT-345]
MGDKNRENKKRGVSLVYVLIVLSMISVFSVSFIFSVKEKSDIISLKNRSNEKSLTSIDYLINKEKKNAERIMIKGLLTDKVYIFPQNTEQYFNSKIQIKASEDNQIKKLIFFPESTKSMGDFRIEKIVDRSGNFYSLPLNENTVYDDMEITYIKTVLKEKITFIEKISFKRLDSTSVKIISGENKFIK